MVIIIIMIFVVVVVVIVAVVAVIVVVVIVVDADLVKLVVNIVVVIVVLIASSPPYSQMSTKRGDVEKNATASKDALSSAHHYPLLFKRFLSLFLLSAVFFYQFWFCRKGKKREKKFQKRSLVQLHTISLSLFLSLT